MIPNLHGNGRALMIFDGVNLETVRQRGVFKRQRRNCDGPAWSRTFRGEERRHEGSKTERRRREISQIATIPRETVPATRIRRSEARGSPNLSDYLRSPANNLLIFCEVNFSCEISHTPSKRPSQIRS